MKTLINISIVLILTNFISCTEKSEPLEDISEIEVLLLDSAVINEIKSKYDSLEINTPHRKDFWTIEDYYINEGDILNRIAYDSLGNIVGIARFKNDDEFFGAEYYRNGQQKGPIFIKSPSLYDSLFAKYYYMDGRVRSKGLKVKGWHSVGEWKDYDSTGRLILIEEYNDSGKLIKKTNLNFQ